MNRPIIISVITILIAVLSTVAIINVRNTNQEMQMILDAAEEAALNQDLDQAVQVSEQLEKFWEKKEKFLLLYVKHNDIDDLGECISELKYLAELGDTAEFCSKLNQTRGMIEHVWISELPIPRNFLFCTRNMSAL